MKLVSTTNSAFSIDIPSANLVSTAAPSYTFSADLYAGEYNLLVNTNKGYMKFDTTVKVNFPAGATHNGGAVSYNGGKFTLTGSKIAPGSYI